MSHFTVTVALPGDITADEIQAALDTALAPYDENKEVEPYVSHTAADIVEDTRYQLYRVKYPNCTPADWYGGEMDEHGNVLSTYNPDSKWDWWVIGGRWGGYWTLKGAVDSDDVLVEATHACLKNRTDAGRVRAIAPESMKPTYAFVDLGLTRELPTAGRWNERGSMGWFGCSSGDKPEEAWEQEYLRWVTSLPADAWLALVDAHI